MYLNQSRMLRSTVLEMVVEVADNNELYFFRRILAATVLKPGSARKAFPCFDEPHLRASFRISLFRDRFHIGLSNSIVQDTDDVGFYMGTGLVSDLRRPRLNLQNNF